MYWLGAEEDTKSAVNKIVADRAKGIPVVTGRRMKPTSAGVS